MSSCPNKNHPDFKKLVSKYGEVEANRLFIENGYEIPVENTINKTKIATFFDTIFPFRDTYRNLQDDPTSAKKIVEKLKATWPDVNISVNGLFDSFGNWIDIQPGEKGMHYRNAFLSVVSWANDAYLETPPHEYAHHYIEMFRNHPLVKKGIEKYGEEGLATAMGRMYTSMNMSSSFVNWSNRFWNMIRGFFGMPDVAYQLTELFNKGERLGEEASGSGVVNYQKKVPLTRYDGNLELVGMEQNLTTSYVAKTIDEAKQFIKDIFTKGLKTDEVLNAYQAGNRIKNLINELVKGDIINVGGVNKYREIDGLDSVLLDDLRMYMDDEAIAEEIREHYTNDAPVQSPEGRKAIDLIDKIVIYIDHRSNFKDNLALGDNKYITKDYVASASENEIRDASLRRKAMYNKIKYKPLRNILMKVEEHLLPLMINARLISKYVSGSEESLTSRLLYKALHKAEATRFFIMRTFQHKLDFDDLPESLKKWSSIGNKSLSIDELTTTEISAQIDKKNQQIKLTQAEIIHLYYMAKQDRSVEGLIENGFILENAIEGRDIPNNAVAKLDELEIKKILDLVENDSVLSEIVKKINVSMDYMYDEVNKTFKEENGFDLTKYDYYMPVFHGFKSLDQRRSKSAVDDFRSVRTALEGDKPVRVVDIKQALSNYKLNASAYATLSLPIQNARKVVKVFERKFKGTQEGVYIEHLKSVINQLEDNSLLFSGQGEKGVSEFINKLQGNFAVSVLGMNVPVMLKQPLAYLSTSALIKPKYLKQAGWGAGGFVGINPRDIFKSLKFGYGGDKKTLLPIEWDGGFRNEAINEMEKYSPELATRMDGLIDRETGEALLNQDIGKDIIELPFMYKGETVKISKNRLMEGIRIFDKFTLTSIWEAVKLEAVEEYGLTYDTKEFWEHVAERSEKVIRETQPTYLKTDQTILGAMSNPIVRTLTMFSSATSKIGMSIMDSAITYMNNPSKENKNKMYRTLVSNMVYVSLATTAINMAKNALLYGFDDDDEALSVASTDFIGNSVAYFYGLNTMSNLVISQIDDKPWYRTMQHPTELLIQDYSAALANIVKGNIDVGVVKGFEASLKTVGFPIQGVVIPRAFVRKFKENETE